MNTLVKIKGIMRLEKSSFYVGGGEQKATFKREMACSKYIITQI